MAESTEAFFRALRYFGGMNAMSAALNVGFYKLTPAMRSGRVSGEIAKKIDILSGGAVRREELRPDLFARRHNSERIKRIRNEQQQQRQR
jgi:hypothetical protein